MEISRSFNDIILSFDFILIDLIDEIAESSRQIGFSCPISKVRKSDVLKKSQPIGGGRKQNQIIQFHSLGSVIKVVRTKKRLTLVILSVERYL
jgi:hypothetical protein